MVMFVSPLATSAKDVYCDTPAITKVIFLEIQSYTQVLKKQLEDRKCLGEFDIFGVKYTSITDQESQRAQVFWNTHLTSKISNDDSKSLFSGANNIPAQLAQDAEKFKSYLEQLRPLVSKSMSDCVTTNATPVIEKGVGQDITVSLSDSATGKYLAYRGLYELLLATPTLYFDVLPSSAIEGSASEVYLATMAKFTKQSGGKNPFFSLKDYRKDAASQCQATEMGLDRINDSIDALRETLEATGKEVQELGDAAASIKDGWGESLLQMAKFTQNFADSMNMSRTAEQRTEASIYIAKSLRSVVTIPLSGAKEFLLGLMDVPSKLRYDGRPVKDFSFSDVQQDIIQVDYEVGRIEQKSISQILRDYTTKLDKAQNIKEQALDEFESKSYDTLGVYASTQFFLQKMDRATQTINKINQHLNGARADFSDVCRKHLPNPNDDCGEEKK